MTNASHLRAGSVAPSGVCHLCLAAAIACVLTWPGSVPCVYAAASDQSADAPSNTNSQSADQRTEDIEELKRRLEVLAQEVERFRSGEEERELTAEETRALGLAPSAASAYTKRQGISVAGYGEALYENFEGDRTSQFDFVRAVIYTGYRFSDRFVFNSEIEFEHGGDELGVEFAYVDYIVNPRVTVRGGLLLMPLGLVNEFHEPNVFLGARRPATESQIIPSTWRENGVGVLGTVGRFSYRGYLVNGFDGSGFTADGLRGGRQNGGEAKADDLGVVGRLDYAPGPGVFVGVGAYRGGADQSAPTTGGGELHVTTTIVELHGQAQLRGFDVRGLFAHAEVDGAEALSVANDLPRDEAVASTMRGVYLQLGYNVLATVTERLRLTPYYRFEVVDTQRDVPAGFIRDPARDVTGHVIGAELRPIYNIVVKADYQVTDNDAGTGRDQFNIALGYAF
ncbi:MAG: hypothetical protein GEV06_16415 [Luteitalea sp.]|nr:hypothetical protein [Luteitalea sp.]